MGNYKVNKLINYVRDTSLNSCNISQINYCQGILAALKEMGDITPEEHYSLLLDLADRINQIKDKEYY